MEQSTLFLQKHLSADERLVFQHQYDDEKRTYLVGLVLALSPLAVFGTHWFWLGNKDRGMTYLMLFVGGLVTSILFIGLFVLAGLGIACIVDAVRMGATTRSHNRKVGKQAFDAVVAMRNNTQAAPQAIEAAKVEAIDPEDLLPLPPSFS